MCSAVPAACRQGTAACLPCTSASNFLCGTCVHVVARACRPLKVMQAVMHVPATSDIRARFMGTSKQQAASRNPTVRNLYRACLVPGEAVWTGHQATHTTHSNKCNITTSCVIANSNLVQVCIFADDQRALPPQLQGALLQSLSCSLHDQLPRRLAAREANLQAVASV